MIAGEHWIYLNMIIMSTEQNIYCNPWNVEQAKYKYQEMESVEEVEKLQMHGFFI